MTKPNFKILLPMVLLFLSSFTALGQSKHDHTWFLGYPPYNPVRKYGGTTLDFRDTEPSISLGKIGLELAVCTAVMSDADGDLAFYSNGFKIYNAAHQLVENGDSLNAPGDEFAQKYSRNVGYSTTPGILALPIPERPDHYALFHFRFGDWEDIRAMDALLYTEVDMSANQGQGRVTAKNIPLRQDTFDDDIAVVRHANGRDWWVVTFEFGESRSLLWLLTPEGIKGPLARERGLPWRANYFTRAASAFSPAGDRFARIEFQDHLQLFRFDRCSGIFSDPVQLNFPGDTLFASGVVFSPNGRYLYANTSLKLYQFDCWAADIQASKTLIGVYDGHTSFHGGATNFYQMRLAPDKKIYMCAPNAVNHMHVIHAPDESGLDCQFDPHGLELPGAIGLCLPIFPNYGLGALGQSPCDSLTSHTGIVTESGQTKIFPNPATSIVHIVSDAPPIFIKVYNASGQLFHTVSDVTAVVQLDTKDWPGGVYFVHIGAEKEQVLRLVITNNKR